jgi:hypothetical protein
MSVMHVWRENRVKDPETRIKTSEQDIEREGRLGTSVCLRPVEWRKSQLTCCLHCRMPVHLHTRFPLNTLNQRVMNDL